MNRFFNNNIGLTEKRKRADENQETSETLTEIFGFNSISAGFDDEFEDDYPESLHFQKSDDLIIHLLPMHLQFYQHSYK